MFRCFSERVVSVEAVVYNANSRMYFPSSECNVSVDAVVCSSIFRLPYVSKLQRARRVRRSRRINANSRMYFPPSDAVCPSMRSYVVRPSGCRIFRSEHVVSVEAVASTRTVACTSHFPVTQAQDRTRSPVIVLRGKGHEVPNRHNHG
jgi:hypothetical protein